MEELMWSNVSSILPISSVPEQSAGNVEESYILEILKQFDIHSTLVQSNAIVDQHPLKQIQGQKNPSLVDQIILTNSRSVTGLGNYNLPLEIPASSSGTSDHTQVMHSKPEIYQSGSLDQVFACLQQVDSTSCNDVAHFSYSYNANQQCSESLDYLPITSLQMDDEMSLTSVTDQDAIGNIKSRVLCASIPSPKITSSIMTCSLEKNISSIDIFKDYYDQSASQCSAESITMKSKAMKCTPNSNSKPKPKPKSKSKINFTNSKDNTHLRMHGNNLSTSSSCLVFDHINPEGIEPDVEAIATMREMIYRAAALRPVDVSTEVSEKPKRKNLRISSDPQTVAARQRRERISDRIRILQRLVPGGTKMDTASMLDEAVNYLKFLQTQVKFLQSLASNNSEIDNMQINSINGGIPLAGGSLPPSSSFSSSINSHLYHDGLF